MIRNSIGECPDELRARLSSQAHLWISELDVWTREATNALLTPEELARAQTLRHPAAQQNYLAGRALVRAVLSHYAELEPSAWTFSAGRFGRPELTGPEPVPRLRFNLTHTRGLAACIVTATADCGVDVEEIERPLRPLRIAEHSFAPDEFQDLAQRSGTELRERFFSYWTLKEAYYKARGSGIPFRLFGARFAFSGEVGLAFRPAADEQTSAGAWQFELFRPTEDHILAVALEPGTERPLEIMSFGNSNDGPATVFGRLDLLAVRATGAVTV
ncbi:MAG: 4'-phosphopantetheinyl transferase superfamily protein [bacterium]|nr:4'-phosphopantetheinyl transferase superfamily protein [bacterium]